MTRPAMKLDTLSYAKKLIAAGCEPKLAEAHAQAQQDTLVEISEDYLSQIATKEDLLRFATKDDVTSLKNEISLIWKELDTLSLKLTVRLGSIMVAGIALLAILIKF